MEQNETKTVTYRWREPYENVWHETRCEVLSIGKKTANIRLLGFGKNGTKPNTVMRVHLKSLVGLKDRQPDLSWQKYSYFD